MKKNNSEGRKVRSGYLPFRKNASNLPPRRSSSRDMGTSSYRYHTATYSPASVSANRRTNDTIFVASMTILDRVLGARAAGVHYRLFSVWTLVPVRLDQQLSDHSTVDEIASGAADCRLTYTMANCPQRRENEKRERKRERGKERKELEKRRGLVVLGSGEENPRVLFRDADQESKTRMRNNALRTGPRLAVE
ncbi:hypothetical protein TNCV_836021 [Trichonephila clavipes]|nr:hypothetical protein TNCV_836021 [Trichonephila clavipes]